MNEKKVGLPRGGNQVQAQKTGNNAILPPASGYVKVPREILQRDDLLSVDKIVWAAVVDRFGRNGKSWPPIRRIAADCGLNKDTVSHSIRRLRLAGLLKVEGNGRGPGRAFRYFPTALSERFGQWRGETRPEEPGGLSDGTGQKGVSNCPKGSDRVSEGAGQLLSEGFGRNLTKENLSSELTKKPRERTPAHKPDAWRLAREAMGGPDLDTAPFRAAWLDWCQHRRELRKPLTPSSIRKQIRKCEALGADAAIRMIERSIEAGWLGLFPDRGSPGGRGQAAKPRRQEETILVPRLN